MNKIFKIELGSNVAFYNNAGSQRIEGSKVAGFPNAFLSRKMYYTKPSAHGVVVKIKGHNGSAARIFLDNGQEIEIGHGTHYHVNGEIGTCVSHQDNYKVSY